MTLTQLAQKSKLTKPLRAQQKNQRVPPEQAVALAATVVTLVPSVYVSNGQQGDFVWEINEVMLSGAHAAANNRSLWVFNDNEQDRLSNTVAEFTPH